MSFKIDSIRDLREKAKLSQQELADRTGIPKDRIAKWEQGKGSPKAGDTETLAKFFAELFAEEYPPSRQIDIAKKMQEIEAWQAGVDATLAVLMSEISPLIADYTGKSQAAAFSQLKKDIANETKQFLEALNKK